MKNSKEIKKEHKSDCCLAPVKIVGGNEGTNHWECEKCGESCNDFFYKEMLTSKSNKKQKCNCKEMTCAKSCRLKHTHKGFFCEICRPVESDELALNSHSPTNELGKEKCLHNKPRSYPKKCSDCNDENICYFCVDDHICPSPHSEDWRDLFR